MRIRILTVILGVALATQTGCCRVSCFLQRLGCRLQSQREAVTCTVPVSGNPEQLAGDVQITLSDLESCPPVPPIDE